MKNLFIFLSFVVLLWGCNRPAPKEFKSYGASNSFIFQQDVGSDTLHVFNSKQVLIKSVLIPKEIFEYHNVALDLNKGIDSISYKRTLSKEELLSKNSFFEIPKIKSTYLYKGYHFDFNLLEFKAFNILEIYNIKFFPWYWWIAIFILMVLFYHWTIEEGRFMAIFMSLIMTAVLLVVFSFMFGNHIIDDLIWDKSIYIPTVMYLTINITIIALIDLRQDRRFIDPAYD
jgi:hypothetical protein